MLRALVRKTDTIRLQLALGQVIADTCSGGWAKAASGAPRPRRSRARSKATTAATACAVPSPRDGRRAGEAARTAEARGRAAARACSSSRGAPSASRATISEVVGVAQQRLGISLPAVHAEAVGAVEPSRSTGGGRFGRCELGQRVRRSCARAGPAAANRRRNGARMPVRSVASRRRCATTAATTLTWSSSTSSTASCDGTARPLRQPGFQTGLKRHGAGWRRGSARIVPLRPSLPSMARRAAPARTHPVGIGGWQDRKTAKARLTPFGAGG